MGDKILKPLIKTSTLQNKTVNIKDTMNFERTTSLSESKDTPKKQKAAKVDYRKTTMKTQKMSLDVLLKLDILDPFLRSAEGIEHDGKLSINEKIDILLQSYLHAKLSTRQLEGFKAVYETYSGE